MKYKILQASVNYLPHSLRPWIKYIPGIVPLQRWLVNRVLSKDKFVHVINAGPATGLRFEVSLPLDKAIWAGMYEPAFAAAIARGVKKDDVCYDVGGYRGYMSGVMALAGASKVVVFEPFLENQRALRRLCDLNPNLPIQLVSTAVGNANGLVRFKVMADTSMGKLTSSSFQAEVSSLASIEVAIQRIDTIIERQGFPLPNVVKIDVEGAELDVLHGAEHVIRSCRPRIFLEAHSAELDLACSQYLLRFGYKIHKLQSDLHIEDHTRHLICTVE